MGSKTKQQQPKQELSKCYSSAAAAADECCTRIWMPEQYLSNSSSISRSINLAQASAATAAVDAAAIPYMVVAHHSSLHLRLFPTL